MQDSPTGKEKMRLEFSNEVSVSRETKIKWKTFIVWAHLLSMCTQNFRIVLNPRDFFKIVSN